MKKICILLLVLAITALSCISTLAETPALPENNKLLSTEWVKGLGSATAKKETVDGQEVYTISGMNSNFSSPFLDIYPSIKAAIGDESEMDLWIVLDVRVVNTAETKGEEFPFGMKLRPKTTSLTATEELFSENYGLDADTFKHQYGSVNAGIFSNMSATEEWTRIEVLKTFVDYDINDELWTKWNLCCDMMQKFDSGASLQVRNVGIYLYDDYEPIEVEEEDEDSKNPITATPTPFTVYKPIGFDKYEITFADALESESKPGATVAPDATSTPDNGGAVAKPDKASALPIVLVAVGAAIVIAVVAIIIIKKKGNKEEK